MTTMTVLRLAIVRLCGFIFGGTCPRQWKRSSRGRSRSGFSLRWTERASSTIEVYGGRTTSFAGSKQRIEAYILCTAPAMCHLCSGIVVVELFGCNAVRPHDDKNVAFAISIGAMHAPSSCGKAMRWSAPPLRSQ